LSNILSNLRRASVLAAGLALATAYTAKPAAALPSELGAFPSTDIYGKENWHIDVYSYGRGLKTNDFVGVGLIYGVGPDTSKIFGATELGIDYNEIPGAEVKFRGALNIKTQLLSTASGEKVVIGTYNLGNKQTWSDSIYLVGAKTFKWGRVHVGVEQALSKEYVTRDRTGLQLGFDKALTPTISFACDYLSGDNQIGGVQPTLYYALNDKASVGLGYFITNASPSSGLVADKGQLYAAFAYNFDFMKPAPAAPAAAPAPAAPAAQ